MQLDDRICYCFHVSLRKLVNFTRREQPTHPSQLSECLSAGTGCGWCIPILKKIHADVQADRDYADGASIDGLPASADEYAAARKTYLTSSKKNQF